MTEIEIPDTSAWQEVVEKVRAAARAAHQKALAECLDRECYDDHIEAVADASVVAFLSAAIEAGVAIETPGQKALPSWPGCPRFITFDMDDSNGTE